jgi:hypothetical protein
MHNGSSTIQQQENAMGWVVYDEKSGHMQKYYKLASTAKRICTQHNTERDYESSTCYRPELKVGLLLIQGL